ncbi:MAG TPA: hypothetical protein VGJ26_22405 [Pirellulales bacterium]|jgi:hypothetical protein
MAKKPTPSSSDRADPKKNKSLAIRNVLKKMPGAKASEVAAAVKKEYGHSVNRNRVYMVKTKTNMASDGRPRKTQANKNSTPMVSAALWVAAIKTARQLLKATGSVPNAVALLKAVDG